MIKQGIDIMVRYHLEESGRRCQAKAKKFFDLAAGLQSAHTSVLDAKIKAAKESIVDLVRILESVDEPASTENSDNLATNRAMLDLLTAKSTFIKAVISLEHLPEYITILTPHLQSQIQAHPPTYSEQAKGSSDAAP